MPEPAPLPHTTAACDNGKPASQAANSTPSAPKTLKPAVMREKEETRQPDALEYDYEYILRWDEAMNKAREAQQAAYNLTYGLYNKVVITLSASAFAGAGAVVFGKSLGGYAAHTALLCFALSLVAVIAEMMLSMHTGHRHDVHLANCKVGEVVKPECNGLIVALMYSSGILLALGIISMMIACW